MLFYLLLCASIWVFIYGVCSILLRLHAPHSIASCLSLFDYVSLLCLTPQFLLTLGTARYPSLLNYLKFSYPSHHVFAVFCTLFAVIRSSRTNPFMLFTLILLLSISLHSFGTRVTHCLVSVTSKLRWGICLFFACMTSSRMQREHAPFTHPASIYNLCSFPLFNTIAARKLPQLMG